MGRRIEEKGGGRGERRKERKHREMEDKIKGDWSGKNIQGKGNKKEEAEEKEKEGKLEDVTFRA